MATEHEIVLTWADGRAETVVCDDDETVVDDQDVTVVGNEDMALVGDDDRTILAAADAAGVGLPFGCLTGACGTCVGRLHDGRVAYDRPPRALKPRHVDAGFVLCCIARPLTDCRLTVGARVQSRLVSNPWR